jgi:hypothetical protein
MKSLQNHLHYQNLEEKKNFFTQIRIDTERDFELLFKELLPLKWKEGGIWRGLSESQYKLYNSLQRESLITSKLESVRDVINYIEFTTNKLADWNRRVVLKYFQNNHNISTVPIYAAQSILQHYGCPTPMLDWTRNPNVALYFAVKSNVSMWKGFFSTLKFKFSNAFLSKGKNIKDYFSIYFLSPKHTYYNQTSKTGFIEVYNNSVDVPYIKNKVDHVILHGGDEYLQKEARENAILELIQANINNNESVVHDIQHFPIQRIEDRAEEKVTHYLNVNYNINAQNGLFVLNADPSKPLEEAIINRINELVIKTHKVAIQEKLAKENCLENFLCFDIHKKFIPKIIHELEKVNITKDTMFPDFAKLKNEITFDKITIKMNQVNV